MLPILLLTLISFSIPSNSLTCQDAPLNKYPYCNPNLDALTRAKDLAPRLNLTELNIVVNSDNPAIPRWGIPSLSHSECTHGGAAGNPPVAQTLFPQAITMARSFDRQLIYRVARAISDEVRAKFNAHKDKPQNNHGTVCWAPVVNICRDPRWGRCQEGYGEDPLLQAEFAYHYIHGIHGDDPKYQELGATCKHFDVHTGPEDYPINRGKFDSVVSVRDWVDTFQPAFRSCAKAKVDSYMCSYNAINGIPSCANRELMTDIARKEWNWDGYIVGDCGAITNIYSQHHFVNNYNEAMKVAWESGYDWIGNCGGFTNLPLIAMQQGFLASSIVRASAERILHLSFRLGHFDDPAIVPFSKLNLSVVLTHKEIVREMSEKSMVLLQNKNNALPLMNELKPGSTTRIAILGPCASEVLCLHGDYDTTPPYQVTPLQAFQAKLNSNQLVFSPGCDINCNNHSGFAAAVNAAKSADVILVFLGITSHIATEGHDRRSINIIPGQHDLMEAILAATSGKKVILMLSHGAPLADKTLFDDSRVSGVISMGYAGQEGGNAIFNILSGAVVPSAKTSVTWYQNATVNKYSITDYDLQESQRTYRFLRERPHFTFGYGMSYTSFKFSSLSVSPPAIKACQSVTVQVNVQNGGSKFTGDVIPQVYMKIVNATVPTDQIRLVNFTRVTLKPNEQTGVTLMIDADQMTVTESSDYMRVIEPTTYEVFVGDNLDFEAMSGTGTTNMLKGKFMVTGSAVKYSQC